MNRKMLTILIALVILAILVAPVASKQAVHQLAAPVLISPENNAKFADYTQPILLKWEPVTGEGLTGYQIEVECYGVQTEEWYVFGVTPRITTDTSYLLQLDPDSPWQKQCRWHVTTLADTSDRNSKPSPWRFFGLEGYTWADFRFPTLQLLHPLNNAEFSVGEPQGYEWALVSGAGTYTLYHQKLNSENEWRWAYPILVTGPPYLTFPLNHVCSDGSYCWTNTPGSYRWRVVAEEPGPGITPIIKVSNWRYYTVT